MPDEKRVKKGQKPPAEDGEGATGPTDALSDPESIKPEKKGMRELPKPDRPTGLRPPSMAWEGPPALVVVGGQGLTIGSRLNLKPGTTVLGRSGDVDIPIPDGSMSRRHSELILNGDGDVAISDCGSRHGTFVNDVRVETTVELSDGDYVRLGNVVMKFRMAKKK